MLDAAGTNVLPAQRNGISAGNRECTSALSPVQASVTGFMRNRVASTR